MTARNLISTRSSVTKVTIYFFFQILLEVVHELFQEERILGNLLFKITVKGKSLFDCQDCCVLLLDDEQNQVRICLKRMIFK